MLSRSLKLTCAAVAVCGVFTAAAQGAGGPPPPTATNGHKVQTVASGLGTPTSFAFHNGTVFEGDGGAFDNNGNLTKPGGVFLLKSGHATRLKGSPAFVAGLAWRKGTLYVSGLKSFNGVGEILALFAASAPQNRLIAPAEVASLAVLIASEKLGAMTGQAINVDGGAVMV